jgi:hypothetical protein
MRTAPPPAPRRRRPHPAQRARKIAGTVSVVGMVLLTGCMAVAGKASSTTAATTATTAGNTTAGNTTAGNTSATVPSGTSATTATTPTTTTPTTYAVPGTVSSQADTSTSGS